MSCESKDSASAFNPHLLRDVILLAYAQIPFVADVSSAIPVIVGLAEHCTGQVRWLAWTKFRNIACLALRPSRDSREVPTLPSPTIIHL